MTYTRITLKGRNGTSAVQRRSARGLAALGAALFCCAGQLAHAVPTPAGVAGTVSFNFFPPGPLSVGAFGLHELSGPGGDLSFDSGLGPAPFLSTSATDVPVSMFGRSAGILHYDVEVIGDPGDVAVRVNAVGQASATTVNDPMAAFALRSLWWIDNLTAASGIETPQLTGGFSDSFNQSVDLVMRANQLYRVNILADVGIRGGSAFAFIDPIFSFVGGGSGYSFLFSDGVGNLREVEATPIPEPLPLAMLGIGLLGIVLARRRTRDSQPMQLRLAG